MFSKNSASSRAIPAKKMLDNIKNDPFIPIAWQENHSGMQGVKYLNPLMSKQAEREWLIARDYALSISYQMSEGSGVTKQLTNRLLEPFMWMTVLITSSDWENFFSLRCPQYSFGVEYSSIYRSKKDAKKDLGSILDGYTDVDYLKANKGMAEIHIMELAELIWDSMNMSSPKQLSEGQWHIPFEDKIDEDLILETFGDVHNIPNDEWFTDYKVKIATSMAARTSYTVVGDEKEISYERQIELHDKMINQVPLHASPMEHCARVMTKYEYLGWIRGNTEVENYMSMKLDDDENPHFSYLVTDMNRSEAGWCRNYRGFIQYREILENDNTRINK